MDTCNSVETLLYLTDDELSQVEHERLQEHLTICSRCREIRTQVVGNRGLLLEDPDSSPVIFPDFITQVQQHAGRRPLLRHPVRQKMLRWVGWPSAVAAGLLLILFLGEQAQTVRKITTLEKNLAGIICTEAPRLVDRWALKESARLFEETNGPIQPTPFNIVRMERDLIARQSGNNNDPNHYKARMLARHPNLYNAFIIHSKTVSR